MPRCRPSARERDDHSSHHAVVSAVAAMPSTGSGSRSCERYQVSTNGTSSPASSSNSATVAKSRPRVGRPVIRCTASGPAIAVTSPSAARRTQGTMWP